MAIKGYNFYLEVSGEKVKQNTTLVGSPTFTFTALPSDTDITAWVTAVDFAGLESPYGGPFVFATMAPVYSDGPLSSADVLEIDKIVGDVMGKYALPGVSVGITGPRGYLTKSYGLKDKAKNVALTPDDHFRMGSLTKTFVCHAILRQIDAGTLTLADKLETYVPGVENGADITIEQMLSHRSGVFEYTAATNVALMLALFPNGKFSEEQALKVIRAGKARFAPGTDYFYTNSNYILLGAILGVVTGSPIRELLTDDVIPAAGLTETTWPEDSDLPAPFTKGYKKGLIGGIGDGTKFNPELAGASGALVTTIGDLTKWLQVIRDGTLLTEATHNLWLETLYPIAGIEPTGPAEMAYGYANLSWGSWLGHNGAIPGFSDIAMFHQDNGATIAIMHNVYLPTVPMHQIFQRVSEYLYPGSTAARDYQSMRLRPNDVKITVTGGQARVVVDTPNKVIVPAPALLKATGGRPGGLLLAPDGDVVATTGGVPTVRIVPAGIPDEINLNRSDRPVPTGLTLGVYVTLIGAGGGGGGGRRAKTGHRVGGPGGGGGAVVFETFIPKASLGPTYSVYRGIGGNGGATPVSSAAGSGTAGSNGGDSVFYSGSLNLKAGGGTGAPGSGSFFGPHGNGGVAVITGMSATTATGGDGGAYNEDPPNTTNGAPSGGGAGAGIFTDGTVIQARQGGATTVAPPCPIGYYPTNRPDGEPGGGGAGGRIADAGGQPGADNGGGGGGSPGGIQAGNNESQKFGGSGGDGYTKIRWV